MPPDFPLPTADIETVAAWIQGGAQDDIDKQACQ
jgi:hypothetical protein